MKFYVDIITVKSCKICYATTLRNNKSFLDSICLLKLGLFNVISEASRILQIPLFSGAVNNFFQENLWLKPSFKCFEGSKSLEIFSSSSHRSSTLGPVLPMYICSQTHTPARIWHMLDVDSKFSVWKDVYLSLQSILF